MPRLASRWIVGADRNVAGAVNHEIVDAVVPFQRHGRIEIATRDQRVLLSSRYVFPRGSVSVPAMLAAFCRDAGQRHHNWPPNTGCAKV